MKYAPATLLSVYLNGRSRRLVGRLAIQDRRILFEYAPEFLATGLQLSPFRLFGKPGVIPGDPRIFDGLFGVFNDSLPDGWGRMLLDRKVAAAGIQERSLTQLDRLAYVGKHGMGALSYEPERDNVDDDTTVLKLDKLAADAAIVLDGEEGAVVDKLLKLTGASSGARPKIVAQVSKDRKKIISGPDGLPDGYAHWMIKFPSLIDEPDVGPIEFAYSEMARAAGVEVPETHLFAGNKKKKRYFGIRRFDRDGDRRIHMHSLSGLLHSEISTRSLDYDAFLKATQILTRDVTQMEKAFRLACFNVLAHNQDDHAKNFSYLFDDGAGQWTLSPAYDLVFSSGPHGEQSMMVMGEGKNPGVEHLRALGKHHGIKSTDTIIDEVRAAVARWGSFADAAGVTKKSAGMIGARIAPPPPPKPQKPPAKKPAAKTAAPKKKPAAKKAPAKKPARKTKRS